MSRCDLHGMLATPVETVPRDSEMHAAVARIIEIAREHDAMECVVGLPLNLRGEHTPSTEDAVRFAEQLAAAAPTTGFGVRMIDERLSTVSAQTHLRQAGRTTKQSRHIIDQAAAVVILQHALDSERAQGRAPGTLLDPGTDGIAHPKAGSRHGGESE